VDALEVVVDGYRQLLLGGVLSDYVLVEKLLDLKRLGDPVGGPGLRLDLIVL
jgi:hypothetical protein